MDHLRFYSRSHHLPPSFLPSPSGSSFPFPFPASQTCRWQTEDFVTSCYGFGDVSKRAQSFKLGPTSSHYKVKQCKEVKLDCNIHGVLGACGWCLSLHLPAPVCLSAPFPWRKRFSHTFLGSSVSIYWVSGRQPHRVFQTSVRRKWSKSVWVTDWAIFYILKENL